MRSCPTFAGSAPVEGVRLIFLCRRCSRGRRNTSPTWLARVTIVESIVRTQSVALGARVGTCGFAVGTLSGPMSRLSTLVAVSSLLHRMRSIETRLVLNEVQHLCMRDS